MLRDAAFIARKELAYSLKQRETLVWTFVMPIVFFYFIGTVTGGFAGPSPDRKDPLAVRGDANGGFLMDEIVHRLEAQRYEIVRPASDQAFSKVARRLTIPAPQQPYSTFTDAVLGGQRQTLSFERQGDSMDGN